MTLSMLSNIHNKITASQQSVLTPHKPEEHSQLHFQFSFSSASEWVCSESFEEKEKDKIPEISFVPISSCLTARGR